MGAQVAGAITSSLTPWIAAQFGWTMAFYVAAALAVIGALAWLFVDPSKALANESGSPATDLPLGVPTAASSRH
jgi:ACS family glucarate transporter-like MFS transporter